MKAASSMTGFYTSYVVSLLVFLACSHLARADIAAAQNSTQATRLLLQVGENLFSSYRSALVNQLNGTTLQNDILPISMQCLVDWMKISSNPLELLHYIDAAGKPRSGILRGNVFWIGSYSECLALSDAKYCISSYGNVSPLCCTLLQHLTKFLHSCIIVVTSNSHLLGSMFSKRLHW